MRTHLYLIFTAVAVVCSLNALRAADAWTMAVIPDTQNYCKIVSNAEIFDHMTTWLAAQANAGALQLVLHEGDIVEQNNIPQPAGGKAGDQNSTQQWMHAARAIHRLNGQVPYVLSLGNHDYGNRNSENRTTRFHEFFKPEDNPLNDPAKGGLLKEMGPNAFGQLTMENAAYVFDAPNGVSWLILSLEWAPRAAAVAWANSVLAKEAYKNHRAILLTHAYLNHDDTRFDWAGKGKAQGGSPHAYGGVTTDCNDGEELWNQLVRKHPQFCLVFNGHVGGDQVGYLKSFGDHGNVVHQMLFNAQFLPRGGQGWLRLLTFSADGKTVDVVTRSRWNAEDDDPATPEFRTTKDDQFQLDLSERQKL